MKYIDLTQPFHFPMSVYSGDPEPKLEQVATIEKNGFTDHRLTTTMHVGTHIDAPLHMIAGGKRISDFPIEKFIGRAKVIDARGQALIDTELLEDVSRGDSDILLIHSTWSEKFGTQSYYESYPIFMEAFAERVIELGFHMVGIDWPSPELDPTHAIHKTLLGNDVLLIENLTNVDKLLGIDNCIIYALPMPYTTDSAQARVIAVI